MRPVKRTVERPKYEKPTIVELPKEDRQVQAGTLPPNASELGHKGRSWRAR